MSDVDSRTPDYAETDIAIVGLAARLPGAQTASEFWRNLCEGVESIRYLSDSDLLQAGVARDLLRNPSYVKSDHPLEGAELFDADFFGLTPTEASVMDPQHRQFLECVWEALEDAGHVPESFPGAIGVFGGSGMNAYLMLNVLTHRDLVDNLGVFFLRHTGNDKDFLATRASYELDLRGPSVNVQTACSTSLVAVHLACQSLISGESDLALAGGVTINLPLGHGYLFQEGEVLSPDGHCHAFDHRAAGTIFGNGVGVVALRRLQDALEDRDSIRAIIKGTAVNNDGSGKVGYFAPSVDGQAKAILEALTVADVDADTISYVEAHGTGTPMGDPIEIEALTLAFREHTDRVGYCRIGSVKTNIGHLDTAAGVASLIKTALALENREIPASLHYEAPNPQIDFAASPFVVNHELTAWERDGAPRRAGVSSLGVGGTNAHVILEEAPLSEEGDDNEGSSDSAHEWQTLLISAKSPAALDSMRGKLADRLEQGGLELADVAFTLRQGRATMPHRACVAARSLDDAAAALREADSQRYFTAAAPENAPALAFMFSGAGTQYPGMGQGLYASESVYRDTIDSLADEVKRRTDLDLKNLLFPPAGKGTGEQLESPLAAVTSLFITELAMARLWLSVGVEPDVFMGHSLGEYAAACLAGVLDERDALSIVIKRGEIFCRLEPGAMLSVPLPESELREIAGDDLDIAAINAPGYGVVSGPEREIDALTSKLESREIEFRRLRVRLAGHSKMLEPHLDEFSDHIKAIRFNEPNARLVSNLTGRFVEPNEVTTTQYWVDHLRRTVRFADGIAALFDSGPHALLEVGPGTALTSLVHAQGGDQPVRAVPSMRHPNDPADDIQAFRTSCGRLWLHGVDVDWNRLDRGRRPHRVSLPTYPFEKKRHWLAPQQVTHGAAMKGDGVPRRLANSGEWLWTPIWQRTAPLPDRSAYPVTKQTWLIFADEQGFAAALAAECRARDHEVIEATVGSEFHFADGNHVTLQLGCKEDYERLFEQLERDGRTPHVVAHCWALGDDDSTSVDQLSAADDIIGRSFISATHLLQAIAADPEPETRVLFVTDGVHTVGEHLAAHPLKATILGPTRVAPNEVPELSCCSCDIDTDLVAKATSSPDDKARVARLLYVESQADRLEPVVAFRDGDRWIQKLETCGSGTNPPAPYEFRRGGVYLLTGGLGDLALVHAEYLAHNYQAKLALVSRRNFPAECEWVRWLNDYGERHPVCRRIRQIERLQELGAEVIVLQADVTDHNAMEQAVRSTVDRFGALHGVFHSAGRVDDGPLASKQTEDLQRVLAPKVQGTLVLDAVTRDLDLDITILFSSTSSFLGLPGQIDYAAANSFLDAFAQSRVAASGSRVVAINWGVWKGVGMAARAVDPSRAEQPTADELRERHPLLNFRDQPTEDETRIASYLTADRHWVLDGHRAKTGHAVLPGTGCIELIAAAFREVAGETAFRADSLALLNPIEVRAEAHKEVEIRYARGAAGYAVTIDSRDTGDGPGSDWRHNVTCDVSAVSSKTPRRVDLDSIHRRCKPLQSEAIDWRRSTQGAFVDFGERWNCLTSVSGAEDELLAEIRLNEKYQDETVDYQTHPALLDVALGAGLLLIDSRTRHDNLYVPMACESFTLYAPLPAHFFSHVRLTSPGGESHGGGYDADVITMDATLVAPDGAPLMSFVGFTLRRIDGRSAFATTADRTLESQRPDERQDATVGAEPSRPKSLLEELVDEGIPADEGILALEKALGNGERAQVLISSLDFSELTHFVETQFGSKSKPQASRSASSKGQAEARDEVEAKVREIWSDVLGVDVGLTDSFFDLGGHSILAVRLLAKIKKTYSVELPLASLFQAPTVEKMAAVVKEKIGFTPSAAGETAPSTPQYVVELQRGAGLPRLFCVHGVGGNVLKFSDLARRLGSDQPFYGIQARGVDGKTPPHTSIGDMASSYLEEVRQVQETGPYFLCGYSAGGVIAFEMAQQLLAAGEEVALLAFLDTYHPSQYANRALPGKTEDSGLKKKLRRHWKRFVGAQRDRFKNQMLKLHRRLKRPLPPYLRPQNLALHYYAAVRSHETGIYPGDVINFVAGEKLIETSPSLGWDPYVAGDLTVETIPGTHDDFLLEPNVLHMIDALRKAIDSAAARSKSQNFSRT